MSENMIKLTMKLINEQPDVKSLLELPQIKAAWVSSYEKVTGRTDGGLKFENEKVLFMRQIAGSKVKKGYELIQQEIYGIVDDENETMVFLDCMGREIADRTRQLSAKEKNDYLGMFAPSLRKASNQ